MGNLFYGILQSMGYDHPVHPILVHVTIGSIVAAFLFDYIGLIFKKPVLFQTARHTIILASIAFLFAGLIGLFDWQHFYQKAMNATFEAKFVLSGVLLLTFVGVYIAHARTTENNWWRHSLYLIAFLCAVGLGYFGGNLVYG
jgi:uncharacterized membrane protein